ncbi:MAG: hypothetical protein ABIR96_12850 [Bdellovibrionota bacterium]
MKSFSNPLTLLTLVASFCSMSAQAFQGSIAFDGATQARHYQTLNTVMDVASDCLQKDYDLHKSFFRKYGVSAFYGSNSAYAHTSRQGKIDMLRRLGKPAELVDVLKVTSCVGLTMKCLERGFVAAGQNDIWARVKGYVSQNGYDGTTLQAALGKLGWKILYWNPDPSQNSNWDAGERGMKSRGSHSDFYHGVMSRQSYYGVHVDDAETLVGFGTNTPRKFANVPFFVGTAHGGYHVFPGMNGVVIEGHSMKAINDPNVVESAEFNPIKNGGAPHGNYRSGIIAVPPGYGF